ncbi:hypothetical protein GCM10022240_17100 [Microbacterium kribbense]|uniref:Uncharacterized protein n=1 Tax=Microbacterium kribbense TaxID=433645 RepID=A0ABP7GIH9_9MICO
MNTPETSSGPIRQAAGIGLRWANPLRWMLCRRGILSSFRNDPVTREDATKKRPLRRAPLADVAGPGDTRSMRTNDGAAR